MGNWRTVHIIGKCDPGDVPKLAAAIDPGPRYENFGPLSATEGLAGLGMWAAPEINRIGNLAERDYSVESVAEHVRRLKETVPSLLVAIDCGGDYESTECIKTVLIGEDGTVAIIPPQVDEIGEIPEEQLIGNLFKALARPAQ